MNKLLPYKQDIYTLFMMSLCTYLLYAPQFIELTLLQSFFWLFLSLIVNFIVNLINHNHSHVGTFGYRPLNIFFDFWLTLNRGASAIFIKIIHNINHHTHSGTDQDWFCPENEGKGRLIFRPLVYLKQTLKRFREGARSYYDQMPKAFNKQRKLENIFIITVILFCLYNNWKAFIVFVFIPWYFGNMFLVITNLIFHKNALPHDKYNISYNYVGRFENIIFLNGGYHTAHHLKPNVHWSQLKELHDQEVAPKIKDEYVKDSMFTHFKEEYFKLGYE
ncbi:MAG: fatty acid desaturase [Oligoflexia bacterium]|nr:fatty acid desaturase [Oligoflexia bacterium]